MNIKKLSNVASTILITGETGTGKSSLAKKIHSCSARSKKPFVSVNLASMSDELVRSELFGHKKGSFTGATADKEGFLEKVCGGTLFLDEVGDISADIQKKLLDVIECREFVPVGSTEKKSFKGVIIVATNRNLKEMVKRGEFREDLYFRIRVFHKELAPMRDSKNLAQLINDAFVSQKIKSERFDLSLTKDAIEKLMVYSWPGNYRELHNTMEYIVHMSEPDFIELPVYIEESYSCEQFSSNFHDAISDYEKRYLLHALRREDGFLNKTALRIGLNKVTLISKLKKYGIDNNQLKKAYNRNISGF